MAMTFTEAIKAIQAMRPVGARCNVKADYVVDRDGGHGLDFTAIYCPPESCDIEISIVKTLQEVLAWFDAQINPKPVRTAAKIMAESEIPASVEEVQHD